MKKIKQIVFTVLFLSLFTSIAAFAADSWIIEVNGIPLNTETRLIKAWNSLLGEQVASYTTKLYIQRGVLYVHLSSSVLRSELSMCRNMLMDRLNKQVGRQIITNIIFR